MAAPRGRPRRIDADTTSVIETVRGEELICRLAKDLNIYGFACPVHGLRFYAIAQPGTALRPSILQAAADDVRLPAAGRLLCCDMCNSALGWHSSHTGNNALRVPMTAYDDLRAIADAERSERKRRAERRSN